MSEKPPPPINTIQQRFIEELLSGKTIKAAAIIAGCSRRAAMNWMRSGPVRDAYEAQREASLSKFQERLANLHTLTIQGLEDILKNKKTPAWVRFGAMKLIYETTFSQTFKLQPPQSAVDLVNESAEAMRQEHVDWIGTDIHYYDNKEMQRMLKHDQDLD